MTTKKRIIRFLHDHFGLKELKERKSWMYAIFGLLILFTFLLLLQLYRFLQIRQTKLYYSPIITM